MLKMLNQKLPMESKSIKKLVTLKNIEEPPVE